MIYVIKLLNPWPREYKHFIVLLSNTWNLTICVLVFLRKSLCYILYINFILCGFVMLTLSLAQISYLQKCNVILDIKNIEIFNLLHILIHLSLVSYLPNYISDYSEHNVYYTIPQNTLTHLSWFKKATHRSNNDS